MKKTIIVLTVAMALLVVWKQGNVVCFASRQSFSRASKITDSSLLSKIEDTSLRSRKKIVLCFIFLRISLLVLKSILVAHPARSIGIRRLISHSFFASVFVCTIIPSAIELIYFATAKKAKTEEEKDRLVDSSLSSLILINNILLVSLMFAMTPGKEFSEKSLEASKWQQQDFSYISKLKNYTLAKAAIQKIRNQAKEQEFILFHQIWFDIGNALRKNRQALIMAEKAFHDHDNVRAIVIHGLCREFHASGVVIGMILDYSGVSYRE